MIDLKCSESFSQISVLRKKQCANPCFNISSIIIVGGLLNYSYYLSEKSQEEPLSENDYVFLQDFVRELVFMGVGIHDSLKIQLSNFLYEDDFIRDLPYADFIFLNAVNKSNSPSKERDKFMRESPLLREGETWGGALNKANPPIVGVNGYGDTFVEQTDVCRDHYKPLSAFERNKNRINIGKRNTKNAEIFVRRDLNLRFPC